MYDYALTLSDEQRLVWPSKLSYVKVSFYLNRYVSLLMGGISTYGMTPRAIKDRSDAFSSYFALVLLSERMDSKEAGQVGSRNLMFG